MSCLVGMSLLHAQSTLFTLLKSKDTGIDFNNKIVDTQEHNILIYSNYYGGAGVGVGDFNRDGKPDLYFTGNLVSDRLYYNIGDFQFEDVTEQAGIMDRGGWSSGVAVADVNNDGWEDIYVSKELYDDRPDLRKNELYINNGDGTFTEMAASYGVDSDARTRHALFFDYDKDGWLDLYLLNHPPNAGNYSNYLGVDENLEAFASRLFRNDGAGKFVDVSVETGILRNGYPNSASAVDFNNDGWTDLYVANDFAKPDWLFLNNGDGTFTNVIDSVARHISFYSMGVDATDINNDGWNDIMVLDMQAEDNFRIKSNMSGMDPSAFWKVYNEGGHHQYMFNVLQLNQGKGATTPLALSDIAQMAGVSSTDWSWSNLITDFDNDGWKDIFITNGLLRDIRNTDSDKNMSKHVQKVVNEFIKANPNAGDVSIWDILDLDAALEIIPSVPLQNYAYKNNGDLTFSKVIDEWGFDRETFSNGSAYADFDGDGDLDLAINNINEPAFIYQNQSEREPGTNFLRIRITDQQTHRSSFGVKVQVCMDDQRCQWHEYTNVRGMYSTSEPIAHFGVGALEKVDSVIITWWDGQQTVLQDVQTNQLLTVDYSEVSVSPSQERSLENAFFKDMTAQTGINYQHEENHFDDFEKQVLLPHKMSQFGPAMAVGDVDNDGKEDLFFGGAAGFPARLFIQRDKGYRAIRLNTFEIDANYEDMDAVFFDYDGDGDQDLYVVSGGNAHPAHSKMYADRLYENNGNGVMTRREDLLPQITESGSCVRPYDFDNDGDLDLFIGGRHHPWNYPSPTTSRILENQEGVLVDVTAKRAPQLTELGMVTDALWMDYDGDAREDLVIVGEWMPITVFKQTAQRTFNKIEPASTGMENTEGWWFSITAADMDGDGDDDLIAGNLGLNYKYKTTKEEPFEVYYHDFDENGSNDIVLSYYNYGKKYPLRGRSCSSQQVPMLKEKFPTYDLFAEADLETVYTPQVLEEALHYHAATFASIYLENLGNGQFHVRSLPNEAQLSSVNSILVEDFDRDGHLDLLLAGNLFVSEIETPRNDAGIGLLLTGDGTGHFEPVSPSKSGVYLPYDVKKAAIVKRSNGEPMVVVASNNEKVVVLGF